jgi:hypothetical protein
MALSGDQMQSIGPPAASLGDASSMVFRIERLQSNEPLGMNVTCSLENPHAVSRTCHAPSRA